jgi:hypothetical protein
MKVSKGLAVCAAIAMAGLPAAAQTLTIEQILEKMMGSWAHEAKGVACGDGAVAIRLSADQKAVTIANWPAGATRTFDARWVVSVQSGGQADKGGTLSLIDMKAAPPVFLTLTMPGGDTVSIQSQTRASEPATVFTRCPSAG